MVGLKTEYPTVAWLLFPYLNLPYLTLPYLTLPYLTLPYLTLPYLVLPSLTLPCLTLPYLTLPYLTLSYLTLHYLTLPTFFCVVERVLLCARYRELMLSIQMEAAVFPTSCHVQPNLVNLLQRYTYWYII